ncbi:MAG: hypothetical protein AABY22_28275 [Nanoarchaeota archaeon]
MNLKGKRVKGNRNRRKAIEELEKEGYVVEVVEKTGKFVKVKDFFGLFDLVAINRNGKIKWIQIKSNRKPNLTPFKQFRERYSRLFNINMEVWIWKDRIGFEKIIIE